MFDELFNELKERYAGRFDWADIRGDQTPSLEALDSALGKNHPLYDRKRAEALAKRESSGDVLYLLEDGRYVVINPLNLNFDKAGFAVFYEFADIQRAVQHIRDEYAEECLQEIHQENDEELAEIWRERKRTAGSYRLIFWAVYFVSLLSVYYLLLIGLHWLFTKLGGQEWMEIFSFEKTYHAPTVVPGGDEYLDFYKAQGLFFFSMNNFFEEIGRIALFIFVFGVIRAAGYALERFNGVFIFENKAIIITALGGVFVFVVIHSVLVILYGFDHTLRDFFMKTMPGYLSFILNYAGLLVYTHNLWIQMKVNG